MQKQRQAYPYILFCGVPPQAVSLDVDVKVDALTKLQAEFESGIEVSILLGTRAIFR